jgi:uncharacterized protein YjdB
MDFEKNYLKIDNEDDIFKLDEENKQQQGQETFCAEERFLVGEENVSAKEENEIIDSKPKNKNEVKENKNINSSHLSSSFFGVVATVVSSVLLVGTAIGVIPSIVKNISVDNFLSRSTELGFIVEKDSSKEYVMNLYNDDYNYSFDLTDEHEYIYSDLIPNTLYYLDIYDVTNESNKKIHSSNYVTKEKDEYNAEIFNSEILDKNLCFNVQYEGSNIYFVTVLVFENGKQVFLYEGEPKDEFDVSLESEFSEVTCKVYINGEMTEFKQFIESNVVPAEDEDEPTDDETTGDDTEKISVESVSLSESEITLVIGDTKAITATVLPENATNKALRWSISGTDVATVEDGLVTAVGVGRTILIVSSNDGGKYKTCVINVTDGSVPIQSISLNESTINMEIGESETLEATVLPENATDKSVTWTSEDPTIATVEDGVVTAVAEGHTTIIATGSDGITWAGCSVYVTDPNPSVKSVSLNESTLEIDLGENSTLTATVMPYNAVDKSVIWESSDTDVATVANGVITAVGVGETTIKVTTVDGGFTATCIVTVVDNSIHVTGVSFENDTESIEQNKTITLVPIIAPTNATNTNVTWESSDTDVATVNSNGVVTGVMPGEATITVTTEDGSFTATCVITVTAIEPTFSNFFIESNKTNSGNEIITFILGYEDPSLVWKNKFIVECLRKIDGEVLFKDYVTPSSKKYAALNSKNRYMLLDWKDSYLEALSDSSEVTTYTINVYVESDQEDQETLIYTDDIYSGNCFSTGKNPIPVSIILEGTVNVSGQVKPQFKISSDGLSGIDNIGVIFSYPATGEGVCTIQNVTLDATITANINLPSGSTPYNVTVYGYIDSEEVTVISEKITISNN